MEERQRHLDEIRKYVNSLTKAQLREELYDALIQLEVDDYDDYDDDYYW